MFCYVTDDKVYELILCCCSNFHVVLMTAYLYISSSMPEKLTLNPLVPAMFLLSIYLNILKLLSNVENPLQNPYEYSINLTIRYK